MIKTFAEWQKQELLTLIKSGGLIEYAKTKIKG